MHLRLQEWWCAQPWCCNAAEGWKEHLPCDSTHSGSLDMLQVDTTILGCSPKEAAEKPFIASMGIYVFKRAVLLNLLAERPEDLDFGGDVIPNAKASGAALPAFL
jgi:ADP-glucose pyrophosphorylase